MGVPTTTAEINRSLTPKTVDKFYVSFYMMPDNISNILGREVMSVSRPNITFNEFEVRNKGKKIVGNAFIEYQPIDVVFYDDMNSLITRAIYEQIKRQTGVSTPSFSDARFEMKVKLYSPEDKIVEEFTIKDCHINSINHSEQVVNDSTNNMITMSISFNDLDYAFPILDQ